MTDRVLFIDLENVQKLDLSLVPSNMRVLVFYGVTQKKLPEDLVVQAQPFGTRLKWIKISGHGPNALDFHIAFYLGQEFAHRPTSDCIVYSGDTGFDPLMRHLQSLKYLCRRVQSLNAAFPNHARAEDAEPFKRLIALLKKEKARPTRRKGLAGKVKSWFPQLTEEVRLGLVQRLFDETLVRESDKALVYAL